jgi:Ca2+-binding RTX toxin-like protein
MFHARRIAALTALVVAAAIPATAGATTVQLENTESGQAMFIIDTTGVADSLSVTGSPSTTATVTSQTNPITAGSGCTQVSATQVSCPATALYEAHLAAGADSFTDSSSLSARINGGPGNDTLHNGTNSPGLPATVNTTINGDDGNDVIDLSFRVNRPDIVSGGAGADTVTYLNRLANSGPHKMSLDGVANDGKFTTAPPQTTEGDNIGADVENLTGSSNADQLIGNAAANTLDGLGGSNDNLEGGAGPDILRGGAGGDFLNGQDGNDLLSGQDGNDTLNGGNGDDVTLGGAGGDIENGDAGQDTLGAQRHPVKASLFSTPPTDDSGSDTFKGGDGNDLVLTADGVADTVIDCGLPNPPEFGETAKIDLLDPNPANCEIVEQAAKDQHPTVAIRSGVLRVRAGSVSAKLSCPTAAPGTKPCAGKLSLRQRGATRGVAAYRIAQGRTRTITLRVTGVTAGRAELRTAEADQRRKPKTTRTRVRLTLKR